MLDEKLLQALVRIVNAQLLETVGLKILKTENIQHTDGHTTRSRGCHIRPVYDAVYLVHDHNENFPINRLDKCVACLQRLFTADRRHHPFALHEYRFSRQRIGQSAALHAEQRGHTAGARCVRDFSGLDVLHRRRFVLHVAQMQEGRKQAENVRHVIVGEGEHSHRGFQVGEFL